MAPVGEQSRPRTATWKRVLQVLFSTGIVAGIFLGLLPRIADYSDVWATIQAMTWLELTTLFVVGAWNVATYWFVLTASLPGLTLPKAAVSNQASTAVANTVPGGSALAVGLTYSMYRSWGFRTSEITLSVLLSGIWNTFVKLGLPIIALVLLGIRGEASGALALASTAGVAVLAGAILLFGLMLRSDRLASRVGVGLARIVSVFRRLLRKPTITDWDQRAVKFRNRTVGLLERRWLGLTTATVVSHLSLYAVLLLALRHVGVSEVEVSSIRVLAAFAFVRLISALPITPGGLGVVELGYAAALGIGVDDLTRAQIVAAVLVFRFITYFLPIPAGTAAYVFWRRDRRWRTSPTQVQAPVAVGNEP
jgi:putative heme transporter